MEQKNCFFASLVWVWHFLSLICGNVVLWSMHIGTLMHRVTAEPCSTAGLLFPSRCPSGTILLTPYSMVWDWRVSRAGPILLYWPKLLYPAIPTIVFYYFSFSLLSVYRLVLWGWGFRLIGCTSLSLILALPTFFNDDNLECESGKTYKCKRDYSQAIVCFLFCFKSYCLFFILFHKLSFIFHIAS